MQLGYLISVPKSDGRLASFLNSSASTANVSTSMTGDDKNVKIEPVTPAAAANSSVARVPQPVNSSERDQTNTTTSFCYGNVPVPTLEFVFATEDTVFFKNNTMRKLDQQIGDLKFQVL
jgi:hypothetical protein